MAAPYASGAGQVSSRRVGKPPPRSSSHGSSPCVRSRAKTIAAAAIGAAHASGSRCCEPTWNEIPATRSPSRAASRSTSTDSDVEQPYLRDSGQSDPSPLVTRRHRTSAPGAASATFATSPSESTTNSDTPSPCANRTSSRRFTGLE